MSVVIIGGNECMERRYIDLCTGYGHTAKIFTKLKGTMGDRIGEPDLMVLFTDTVSHKMVRCALSRLEDGKTRVVRSHSSSVSALRGILEENR